MVAGDKTKGDVQMTSLLASKIENVMNSLHVIARQTAAEVQHEVRGTD